MNSKLRGSVMSMKLYIGTQLTIHTILNLERKRFFDKYASTSSKQDNTKFKMYFKVLVPIQLYDT